MSQALRPIEQCIIVRNRSNRVRDFITRSMCNKSDVILKLYLALLKLHLDHAVQFWSQYYRMDIVKLEAVQRRKTKIIQRIRNLAYID